MSVASKNKGLLSVVAAVLRGRRGSTALLFASGASVLLGFAGLALDGGSWLLARRQMVSAADAAAVAAAMAISYGRGPDGARASAIATARLNGFVAQRDGTTISVATPLADGPYAGDPTVVQVTIRQPQPIPFARLFMDDAVMVHASAIATLAPTTDACALSLTGPLIMTGNSVTAGPACVLASNFTGTEAIQVGNSASVRAFSLYTAGGCTGCVAPSVSLAEPHMVRQPPIANVFETLDTKALPSFTANSCLNSPAQGRPWSCCPSKTTAAGRTAPTCRRTPTTPASNSGPAPTTSTTPPST
jgi:Flp pilus assembly protein TadG